MTAISLKDDDCKDAITTALLDKLYVTLCLESRYELWKKYVGYLLKKIKQDPASWTPVTIELCVFETILLESGMNYFIVSDARKSSELIYMPSVGLSTPTQLRCKPA